MEQFLEAHGDTLALLVAIGGFAWRAAVRITRLESSILLLESKLDSLQRELAEAKSSTQRNLETLYSILRDQKD